MSGGAESRCGSVRAGPAGGGRMDASHGELKMELVPGKYMYFTQPG
jgi:hypothetical protein